MKALTVAQRSARWMARWLAPLVALLIAIEVTTSTARLLNLGLQVVVVVACSLFVGLVAQAVLGDQLWS